MVLVGILLYLWPQMRLVNLGYRRGALQARRARVLQRQKELQVEVATLRQLSRIEKIAVQHLGMRPPQTSQIIYVRLGQHITGSRRGP
jgi:cell division protein FtsL